MNVVLAWKANKHRRREGKENKIKKEAKEVGNDLFILVENRALHFAFIYTLGHIEHDMQLMISAGNA